MKSPLLLFLTPLFAYVFPNFASASFYTPYLIVPYAALLGRLFGVSGVISIAIGGLLLVPGMRITWGGGIGGAPSLYLIALAVAAAAASSQPLFESMKWPRSERASTWLTFAAPLLIGIVFLCGSPNAQVSFSFSARFTVYFMLFVLGMTRVRILPLSLGVIAAVIFTLSTEFRGIPFWGDSPYQFSIGALQPVSLITAITYISAGSATGALLKRRPLPSLWRHPYPVIATLLILWFLPYYLIELPIGQRSAVHFSGDAALLPVAAFVAGLLRGPRGVSAVVTAVVFSTPLRFAVPGGSSIPVEAFFVASSYGALGVAVAEPVANRVSNTALRRWAFRAYLVFLLVLAAGAIYGEGGPLRIAFTAFYVAAVIVLILAAIRIRREMIARGLNVTSDRWGTFVALLSVLAALAMSVETAGKALWQLVLLLGLPALVRFGGSDSFYPGDGIEFLFIGASVGVYVAILISTLRAIVKVWPKVSADVRKVARYLRYLRRDAPSTSDAGPALEDEDVHSPAPPS